MLAEFAAGVEKKLREGGGSAEVPGNPEPAPKKAVPVPKTRDGALCRICNLCAQACPAKAIVPGVIKFNPERCISCMRCVHMCPYGAIRFDSTALTERLKANFSTPRPVETFL